MAAKDAVTETALSRSVLSLTTLSLPAVFILFFGAIGVRPTHRLAKVFLEVSCVAMALRVGRPFSIAIFNPLSIKKGSELETECHGYEYLYYNKGL